MARAQRIQLPGVTLHVVQRGHNRDRTFFSDDDYRTYLYLLSHQASRYETSVHAYVLMTNHVHLLLTSRLADGISRTMQQVASIYSRRVNERLERRGSMWEGRFKSCLIDSDSYLIACYRYIELNPVRAGIVSTPEEYRWSSYRENAGFRAIRIVEPHERFTALGCTVRQRVERYRALIQEALPEKTVAAIRRGWQKGTPLKGSRGAVPPVSDTGV